MVLEYKVFSGVLREEARIIAWDQYRKRLECCAMEVWTWSYHAVVFKLENLSMLQGHPRGLVKYRTRGLTTRASAGVSPGSGLRICICIYF